jgi:protein-disulfide isomerase
MRAVIAGGVAASVLIGLGVASLLRARHRPSATTPADAPVAPASAAAAPDAAQDLLLAARTKGDPDAPIVMYEVSDFQCPFCRQFWAETLPALEQEYIRTGKVRLTFINFPITELHPNASAAHEAAMCAAQQNRFWPMHDLLYAHQDHWAKLKDPKPYFRQLADSARVDGGTYEACIAAGRIRQLVGAEAEASWKAGVRSTPSFIVQGALLAGTAPIAEWRPILDSIYRARTGKGGQGRRP